MNLITCKKSRGGGNSLKFRVESCEFLSGGRVSSRAVGGSSWRLRSLFSFILSVALLLGVNSAWAVSVTYCQPEGTTPAKPIWGHELGGILTVDHEITTTPQLAFAGITLDDIPAECSFFSQMYGPTIDDDYAPVVGMHRQTCDTNGDGHIDKIALQMGVYDGGHTKCVIVVLTNGDDGVYVQRYCQLHKNKSPNMWKPYYTLNADGTISAVDSPDSWNMPGTGYRLAGFKIRGTSPLVSSALAFPGKTIAELKDFAFVSDYRFGRAMQVTATNNFATFVTHWTNPNDPDDQKLVMQIANPNNQWKAAILEMTDGEGGVWVRQSRHAYNNMNKRFTVNATTGEVTGGTQTVDTPPQYAVHGLYALPLETVKRSPTKIKAFSNGNPSAPLTLDDIKDGTFSSRMCGINVDVSFLAPDSALGYNKKVYKNDDGSVTNIIVEFQVRDDSFTKCVVVSFENGADGIYATALDAKYTTNAIGYEFYTENRTWNSGISNGTLSEYFGGGYGVFDLRVAVEEATAWTLDQNRTWSELRNGATLAADEVVRISVTGDYPTLTIDENVNVSKVEFVNGTESGTTTNSVAVSAGVSFNYATLSLGEHVCLAVTESFAPSAVTAMGSTLIYTTGTSSDCAAISGSCNVEVVSGATLFIENGTDISGILNNGTVVKTGEGTATLPFDNASTGVTIVRNGRLKVASVKTVSNNPYSLIPDGVNQEVRVATGATFDLDGIKDLTVSVRLAESATFANYGAAIENTKMQTVQIILDGNATAEFSNDFGLLAPGYKETRLDLGSNTLTLDGSGEKFWLCNTTINGTGTIEVSHGYLNLTKASSIGENCTLKVLNGGALVLDADLTVKNFVNGTVHDINGTATLTVKGTLTPGTEAIPKLTLADGATVKATGTAQSVSTKFAASGTITVDASAVTKEQFKDAGKEGISVLTVPADYTYTGVNWNVDGARVDRVRSKWRVNEDGTKTLYIARSEGFKVIVR